VPANPSAVAVAATRMLDKLVIAFLPLLSRGSI
jgi:hypothetical protein